MARKVIPDIVNKQELVTLLPTATVREAAQVMQESKIGAVLVVHEDTLNGIFTERDLDQLLARSSFDPERVLLTDVMTPDPHTISPDTTVVEALSSMDHGGFRHLPVVDNGRIVGIVSRRDFIQVLAAQYNESFETDRLRQG